MLVSGAGILSILSSWRGLRDAYAEPVALFQVKRECLGRQRAGNSLSRDQTQCPTQWENKKSEPHDAARRGGGERPLTRAPARTQMRLRETLQEDGLPKTEFRAPTVFHSVQKRTGNLDKNADAMEKRQFARCRDIIAGWIFLCETYLLCTLAGTGVVMRCTFLAVLLSCRCV